MSWVAVLPTHHPRYSLYTFRFPSLKSSGLDERKQVSWVRALQCQRQTCCSNKIERQWSLRPVFSNTAKEASYFVNFRLGKFWIQLVAMADSLWACIHSLSCQYVISGLWLPGYSEAAQRRWRAHDGPMCWGGSHNQMDGLPQSQARHRRDLWHCRLVPTGCSVSHTGDLHIANMMSALLQANHHTIEAKQYSFDAETRAAKPYRRSAWSVMSFAVIVQNA